MNLFSRNSGLIVKTFLYQLVMSLFGFMMYSGTYRIPFLFYVGQITVVLFFFYIMSSQMYQGGAKMCEYDRGHDSTSSPFAGFLFAVIAFLPTIILSVISLISPPFATPETTNTLGYVSYTVNHSFQQGMYMGITQLIYPTSAEASKEVLASAINSRCLLHLLGALPGILASGIGYYLGYQNFKKDKKSTSK